MKKKVKEWLWRYGSAELLSTAATFLAALIAFRITGSRITTALVATWAGNIFYFGCILIQDVYRTAKEHHQKDKRYTQYTLFKNIRALLIEFGPAELLDSLLIRPTLMYYLPILLNNIATGIILAKIAADITFYLPAIISYELSKKRLRRFD